MDQITCLTRLKWDLELGVVRITLKLDIVFMNDIPKEACKLKRARDLKSTPEEHHMRRGPERKTLYL